MTNETKTAKAQEYLNELRKHPENYSTYAVAIRTGISRGEYTLADLGITESALTELERTGRIAKAQEYLNELRKHPEAYRSYVPAIRWGLDRGDYTVAEIGVTEKELESFVPAHV